MKVIVFIAVWVMSCTISAYAQNNFQLITSSSESKDPFDVKMDKYVWSHNHLISNKKSKPLMNSRDIENFISIGEDEDLSISPDGKYFAYSLKYVHYGKRTNLKNSLVVQDIEGSWHEVIKGNPNSGFFSADSKLFVFQQNDSLFFLSAGKHECKVVSDISHYAHKNGVWLAYMTHNSNLIIKSLISRQEIMFNHVLDFEFDKTGEWIIYRLRNESKDLMLYNIVSGKEHKFLYVDGYTMHTGGSSVLVYETIKSDSGTLRMLQYLNLADSKKYTIWSTTDSTNAIYSYNLDGGGKQAVFIVNVTSDTSKSSIWYWKEGMDKAILKVNRNTEGVEPNWVIQKANFTDNGQYILFFATEQQLNFTAVDTNIVMLDIWSYKDNVLQSRQQYINSQPKIYSAVIKTDRNQAIKIVKGCFERIKEFGFPKGEFVLVSKSGKKVSPNEPNFGGDRFWEKDYNNDSVWLVSLKDGSRRLIKGSEGKPDGSIRFSPEGKYLVYFDAKKQCNYFSIDLTTGKVNNISAGVPSFQLGWKNYFSRAKKAPESYVGIAGWIQGDKSVLVYDNYDIWQLDLSGKTKALNITNGYGRRNNIRFALIANGQDAQYNSEWKGQPLFPPNASLLLNAFDMKTKYCGIYKKELGEIGSFERLWNGPYTLEKVPATTLNIEYLQSNGINFIKAAYADMWIVKRQNTLEAPNYFLTTNFKEYKPLTDIQPQKDYNWLSAQLHTFKNLDGTLSQGVLYKPENFDPSKKYPVIIVFYSQFTRDIFKFPVPDYNWSPIAPGFSPMLLLNNGYLIFTPDIYTTPLKYGSSALNVIEGAAIYLKKLSYVDKKHIGGAAHSWSAKLASYVFTHSHELSAMALSEGFVYADLINTALSINYDDGRSNMEMVEDGFEYGNLWEHKSTWLDQTTVLNADKIETPLLLYCGKKSSKDYQDQTIQFFSSLRRLEKRVWWLQYDNGDHTLFSNDAKDYTIRYLQFFDHYLKEAPAPRWMTNGLPHKLKGIESRLELDPMGSCALSKRKDCLVCKKWNMKCFKQAKMFEEPINKWHLE
ncbi:hypothetical protein [Niastella sp. OAS944]|uniref:S9 family peptidase n=1 Tax=Niastella sp. OAS944 TaxID=2664089 RepID=UPI00347C1AB5|nr:dipeptidyl aminopeptidase/acylaminoacyl peptidase [Chitinophagaceae bacterium OAS944]